MRKAGARAEGHVATRPQHILSLCSGIGGLDLGVEAALGGQSRVVAYVEREAYPAAVLCTRAKEGWISDAPVWSDVSSFNAQPWAGLVDGVIGSYPCQCISNAGKRKGTADERWLWPHFARIIKDCHPSWCFFENVAQHVNVGLDIVWEDLCRMGYDVEAGLFEAAEVGACHIRRRLFILARHQELPRGHLVGAGLLANPSGEQFEGRRALQPESDHPPTADSGPPVSNTDRSGVRLQSGRSAARRAGADEPADHGGQGNVADTLQRTIRKNTGGVAAQERKEDGRKRHSRADRLVSGGAYVADALRKHGRRRDGGLPQGKRGSAQSRLGPQAPEAAVGGGENVADADLQRSPIDLCLSAYASAKQPPAQRSGGADVADASGQRGGQVQPQAWEWIAHTDWPERWGSSAGIRRVAAGIPSRVDRLRALGNAVVPACAAHAFTTLVAQAEGRQADCA